MKNIRTTEPETTRENIRTIRANMAALVNAHQKNRFDGTPDGTINDLVTAIGYDAARVTVAELVNSVGEWDERVSRENREWAAEQADAANRDELRDVNIYQPSEVHPAHIDQIANAMRRYEPENEPETVEEDADEMSEEEEREAIKKALDEAINDINGRTDRSAWKRGVAAYAVELCETVLDGITGGWLEPFEVTNKAHLEKAMLNGAADWAQYSWGGCALCYNGDIAERLCCPSELKKTAYGSRRPNASEEWLDTQTRALRQAALLANDQIRRRLISNNLLVI